MQSETPDSHRGGKVVVAESPILTIESCSCGVMHLHFGPVSMRFTEAGLHDVHRTIAQALMQVAVPDAPTDNVTSLFSASGPVRGEA
jgi:hypothetical protein